MGLVYEDRTKILKKMFFEVQNDVGLGRQEEAYHQACVAWMRSESIPFRSKWQHPLMLGDYEAYSLHPDFVVWDSITVELKAIPRMTSAGELVQLFDYLKCRKDKVGLLVNMGLDRVVDQRVIYDPPSTKLEENWKYWSGAISGRSRELGGAIRNALCMVYDHHQTGYGFEVMERLIPCSIALQQLKVITKPISKAYFRRQIVDESPLDCLIVDNEILVTFTILFDDIQFSVNRGLSYMRALGLEWGIAVDFGKSTARITGLRQKSNSKTA